MLYDMSINAEQVRALRESRGWSQEHLAEVAGLSLRTIQRVEADGRGSRETKLSLAAAFDVPLGRLSIVVPGESVQGCGAEHTSFSLTTIGTLLVVIGIIAAANMPLLIAGVAIIVSGLSVYSLNYLNVMRRAAGMLPLLASSASVSGLSLMISGSFVILLGFVVSGSIWWIPGGIIAASGAMVMLWPLLMKRLIGGDTTNPPVE
ncbi:helix-turn-helix domain-containing protein [Aliidiomarina indica]|uniref:helix-turn-helix domain-containing protein n=1 Tax=Aliidiomarina indica TaxID=2749147 RepID=UPI001E4F3FC6|nr:helix-turn-helix transcriptional regulator [Aliidiomarina indica]